MHIFYFPDTVLGISPKNLGPQPPNSSYRSAPWCLRVCVWSSSGRSEPVNLRHKQRQRRLQHDTFRRGTAVPHPMRRRRRVPSARAATSRRPTRRDRGVQSEVPSHAVRPLWHAADDLPYRESCRVVPAASWRPRIASRVRRSCTRPKADRCTRSLGHRL